MIRIADLSKEYNNQKVLDNISLEINDGEILAVLGESGVGKSVLLKHMMGLIKPDSGEIYLDGESIVSLSEKKLLNIRKRIGYLFQEGALYDFMNVFDNIAFPLREHTSMSGNQIKEKVLSVLKMVDLEGVDSQYPAELSGGMRKRVGLARAIVLDCKILFCDEPTSGLDPLRSSDITDLIKQVSKQMGCTTVITSHDIGNSFRIADRIVIIRYGKIEAMGSKDDLLKCENTFVQDFINK